ncbi:hypothetical protein B296_00035849 [Ensete ventricosum]|uniref:Protein kinase domain-containing protein n=1 Tax=Ensete ventricosum TaxID=4639 RepID=A0A426Y5R6_ENSVE|nr:hypothetical protein B296_00035849 [Ensete ventricosum]
MSSSRFLCHSLASFFSLLTFSRGETTRVEPPKNRWDREDGTVLSLRRRAKDGREGSAPSSDTYPSLSLDDFVSLKQLDRNSLQGNREFLVEVLMLSLLHHPNLVNLIGYCADGDQRLLVYEYMPLGSLEDHLHGISRIKPRHHMMYKFFQMYNSLLKISIHMVATDLSPDKKRLDWDTRMKIAAGAAKGLEYLHDKASPPVIYRDLKCSNILLDEGYHPKLSDFGLAKLGPVGDNTHVSTRVMGTYGYCAPEYAMTGQLTLKSDIYSFGVVLLEIITGRRAIDNSRAAGEHNLVAWVKTSSFFSVHP